VRAAGLRARQRGVVASFRQREKSARRSESNHFAGGPDAPDCRCRIGRCEKIADSVRTKPIAPAAKGGGDDRDSSHSNGSAGDRRPWLRMGEAGRAEGRSSHDDCRRLERLRARWDRDEVMGFAALYPSYGNACAATRRMGRAQRNPSCQVIAGDSGGPKMLYVGGRCAALSSAGPRPAECHDNTPITRKTCPPWRRICSKATWR
jgi:hypothetical protein